MAKLKKQHRATAGELAADSARYAGIAFDQTAPGSPQDAERFKKGQAAPGRPKVGEGAVVTSASLEAGLLRRAMSAARARGMKRSEFLAKALELLADHRANINGQNVYLVTEIPPAGVGGAFQAVEGSGAVTLVDAAGRRFAFNAPLPAAEVKDGE